MMALRRALHFVFKVGDRSKTAVFYRDVLGMKVSQCVSEIYMGFTVWLCNNICQEDFTIYCIFT